MKFREVIKKLRLKNGMTQIVLADKIGIKQNFISRYEGGQRVPQDLKVLRKMAEVLDVQSAPLIWLAGRVPTDVSTRRKKQAEQYFQGVLTQGVLTNV